MRRMVVVVAKTEGVVLAVMLVGVVFFLFSLVYL